MIMKSNTLVIISWREWVTHGLEPENSFVYSVPLSNFLDVGALLNLYKHAYQYWTEQKGV